MQQHLSIESGGEAHEYGKIHRTGCSDLIDPESIGNAISRTEAAQMADAVTCWAGNDGEAPEEWGYQFAPCVKLPKEA